MRWWPYALFLPVVIMAMLWYQQDRDPDPDHFAISAVHDGQAVAISFEDQSGLTGAVSMEILGMAQTYTRTYNSASFQEMVEFATPRYGWAAHPIVFHVSHESLGDIRIKTEIRPDGEDAAPLVFEKP